MYKMKPFDNDDYAIQKIERTLVPIKDGDIVSHSLFEFYVIQQTYYKKTGLGTYNLICQLASDPNKFFILGNVKCTKDEAIEKLKSLVFETQDTNPVDSEPV